MIHLTLINVPNFDGVCVFILRYTDLDKTNNSSPNRIDKIYAPKWASNVIITTLRMNATFICLS